MGVKKARAKTFNRFLQVSGLSQRGAIATENTHFGREVAYYPDCLRDTCEGTEWQHGKMLFVAAL